jgi:hypothetical protein
VDGSFDIYLAPKAPAGKEGKLAANGTSRKSWFTFLRTYGPLEPRINKTWRSGDIELVK